MPIQNKKKTTRIPKATKPHVKRRATNADMKARILQLESQLANTTAEMGGLLEFKLNETKRLEVMLEHILKALYAVGIGPDDIMVMCRHMFVKKVKAD